MEFPRLVYKSAAVHLLVRDDDAYEAALADGWFGTVPEALAPKAPPPIDPPKVEEPLDEVSPPTREELEAKATELGIAFNGRTSDKKLADKIAAELED